MEIEPIDHYISLYLLKDRPYSQEAYEFICYLSLATRMGHLFVAVGQEIHPPLCLFYENPPLDSSVIAGSLQMEGIHGVVRKNNNFYLSKSYALIEKIEKRIEEFRRPMEPVKILESAFLSADQKRAIGEALSFNLSVIYGGPGTGKTHTAGWLVRTLFESLPFKKKGGFSVALAAPTGKAAQRLKASIEKSFSDQERPQFFAMTLHALLGHDSSPLHHDLILVDESSMVDAQMLAKLLLKIKATSRLIFMGDPHQLPPIELGTLFADLCQIGTELTHSHRVDNIELLEASTAIKEGKMPTFSEKAVLFRELSLDELIESASKYYSSGLSDEVSAVSMMDHFRLLTPLVSGPFGVDALNEQLYLKNLKGGASTLVLPIMITKNDYAMDLFNGECGVMLVEREAAIHSPSFRAIPQAYALFGTRRFSVSELPPFTLAFALSVHKSQGSEFKRVQLLIPKGSAHFGRELLYTGATRAKESLEIWSTKEELERTLSQTMLPISYQKGHQEKRPLHLRVSPL